MPCHREIQGQLFPNEEGIRATTMTDLGRFFPAARLDRQMTLMQLAGMTGYRNPKKAASRIARFEHDGTIDAELLARLADVLDIEYSAVELFIEQDHQ